MIAPQSQTILDSTIDLLQYHQWGNSSLFDRCFRKSCALVGATFQNDLILRKLRTFGFAYLRNTGFIDVYWNGAATQWSVSNNCVFQTAKMDFVILGGSAYRRKVRSIFPDHVVQLPHSEHFRELPEGLKLYPSVEVIRLRPAALRAKATEAGIEVVEGTQGRLFAALPNVSTVINQSATILERSPSFELGKLDIYSFENQNWEKYENPIINGEGVFRRNFDYHAPEYFIGFRKSGSLHIASVLEKDWLLVCAMDLLNKNVAATYNQQSHSLSIDMLAGFSLPVLFERCLRSGDVRGPSTVNRKRQYSNILEKSVWKMQLIFPFFRVEVT